MAATLRPARSDPTAYAELDIVRLRSMLYTDEGTVPAGSTGTIVYRHDRGEAYEVEFVVPFAIVATLRAADLAPVP